MNNVVICMLSNVTFVITRLVLSLTNLSIVQCVRKDIHLGQERLKGFLSPHM